MWYSTWARTVDRGNTGASRPSALYWPCGRLTGLLQEAVIVNPTSVSYHKHLFITQRVTGATNSSGRRIVDDSLLDVLTRLRLDRLFIRETFERNGVDCRQIWNEIIFCIFFLIFTSHFNDGSPWKSQSDGETVTDSNGKVVEWFARDVTWRGNSF